MESLASYEEKGIKGRAHRALARFRVRRGRRALERGARGVSLEYAQRAARLAPDLTAAYQLIAASTMPGEDYLALLSRLHRHLEPATYAEIGVASGRSMALAAGRTRAIGVDPHPMVEPLIPARAKIFPTTSDDFFARWNVLAELDTEALDLVFVDGLHTFEQTLRDFNHLERFCDRRTVLAFHDCIPVARRIASAERRTKQWCGDVWKIVPCLQSYRPDLELLLVPTPPSGLLLVTRLDPRVDRLREGYEEIAHEYREHDLPYEFLDPETLAASSLLVPNDWHEIEARLDRARGPAAT